MTSVFVQNVRKLLDAMPAPNMAARDSALLRDKTLTKPEGSLGRLEEIALWLAMWQGSKQGPRFETAKVCLFAANHGIVQQGVSAYPAEVTQQMVSNFRAEGAAVNQICKSYGLAFEIHELSLETPTRDFTLEPAMSEEDCAEAFAYGRASVNGDLDLLCFGEMGIGNTTSAGAIYAALFGGDAAFWTGRGTGLDDAGLLRKRKAIDAALAMHQGQFTDPLGVLRCLGGREIAAIAGAILEARMKHIPVILDGYIVTAAAAILHALDNSSLDHCLAGHVSPEGAHAEVLIKLNKQPLLNLGMRLGEGSGAALAAGIVKAAVACHRGMATFAGAGVSEKG